MTQYPKIKTLFHRDANFKVAEGLWRTDEFDFLKDVKWNFFEKVDGTNIRIILYPGSPLPEIRGKTDGAKIPDKLLTKLQEIVSSRLIVLNSIFGHQDVPVCLYGEGYGGYIQKVGKQYGDLDFILFDVKIGNWWLKYEDVCSLAIALGLEVVPLVDTGPLTRMVSLVKHQSDSIVAKTSGLRMEGLVAKPAVDLLDRSGQRIIAKLKVKDFAHEG